MNMMHGAINLYNTDVQRRSLYVRSRNRGVMKQRDYGTEEFQNREIT